MKKLHASKKIAPCHEGRKLSRKQFQLINTEETNPHRDRWHVDSANPEILTVQEDEDGNEDDDVEIHI